MRPLGRTTAGAKQTCCVGCVLPYIDVKVVQGNVDEAAVAAAADKVWAGCDGVGRTCRQKLATPLHYDLALSAVANERRRARVARVFAVRCDDGGVYDEGRVAHAAASMVRAGGGESLRFALGPAHVVNESRVVHPPKVASVDCSKRAWVLRSDVCEGLQGGRGRGHSWHKSQAAR
jgi:hypothetical protein